MPNTDFEIRENDVLYYRLANGGGYGDVLERKPESVLNDVRSGIVSPGLARYIHGIVLCEPDDAVDWSATQKLRTRLREGRLQVQG